MSVLKHKYQHPQVSRSPQSYRTVIRQQKPTHRDVGVTHTLHDLTRESDLEDLVYLRSQGRGSGRDVLQLSSEHVPNLWRSA